jgi:hypothetical protein
MSEPIQCDNMSESITINGLFKIRSLKKILKYQFGKEWPIIDCLDENFFNDYTQLNHFHQYSNTIQFKFYSDDPEVITVKFRNGDFRAQISVRDNLKKFKKRLISNFYIGKDIIIEDVFGNEYNLYNTVMPIKDEIWLHIPVRDNLNNTTTITMAELKNTNVNIKMKNSKFNLITTYFTEWNIDAIKYYINMLSGVNDKKVTVKVNNLYCEFEGTIEFLNGIFNISGNIKDQEIRTYAKSLTTFHYTERTDDNHYIRRENATKKLLE